MPRNAIRSQFYSTWLRPVLLSSFSLSLSLPTGESENLMWPFIQSSSVRCTQERIDFGCEVFLCFIVDSIRAPGVGAAVIGCPVL